MSEGPVTAHGPVVRMTRGRSTTQWGMVALIVSESMLFLLLLVVYLYYRAQPGAWPPEQFHLPELRMSAIRTAVLLGSSVPVVLAERSLDRRGHAGRAALWWLAALAMAGWFLWTHVQEQVVLVAELLPQEHVYGTVLLTILNFHAAHLTIGIGIGLFVVAQLLTGHVRQDRSALQRVGGLYWHFVDAIWVVVYGLLYLSPHLLGR